MTSANPTRLQRPLAEAMRTLVYALAAFVAGAASCSTPTPTMPPLSAGSRCSSEPFCCPAV